MGRLHMAAGLAAAAALLLLQLSPLPERGGALPPLVLRPAEFPGAAPLASVATLAGGRADYYPLPYNATMRLVTAACLDGGRPGLHMADPRGLLLGPNAPLGARRLDTAAPPWGDRPPIFLNGTFYLASCFFAAAIRRTAEGKQPAHWLLRMAAAAELADAKLAGSLAADLAGLHFAGIVLHQCPWVDDWDWGRVVWEASTARWPAAGLLPDPLPPVLRLALGTGGWVCFERLAVDLNIDVYFSTLPTWLAWADRADALMGIRARAPQPADRCTAPRIAVFARENGTRAFVNLPAVLDLAQSRTSRPVRTISANPSMTAAEQARIFSSFDVLITPHGSHMANMVLGPRTARGGDAAFVEVVPFVRYAAFRDAAEALGYRFVLSAGHRPVAGPAFPDCPADPAAAVRAYCSDPPACGDMPRLLRDKLTNCGTEVDLARLGSDLDRAVGMLCDGPRGPPPEADRPGF